MSNGREVSRRSLDLQDNPEAISPPIVSQPYACATAVVVTGFAPHAGLELDITGGGSYSTPDAGFAEPHGYVFNLTTELVAGQVVIARQIVGGVPSPDTIVEVISHLEDYPEGLPRPKVDPAPIYNCGSRTGISNLVVGSDVWIEDDNTGSELGRKDGANDHQGINLYNPYTLSQEARAYSQMCDELSPASQKHTAGHGSDPMPIPGIDPNSFFVGSERIRLTSMVNGARFTVFRNGSIIANNWPTWGYAHFVTFNPPLIDTDEIEATQKLCPGSESERGGGTPRPCSELPAPKVAPVQAGDDTITILSSAAGAHIRIYGTGGVQIGYGSGSQISLIRPVAPNETLHIIQDLAGCTGQRAWETTAYCVAPPISPNPASLDLYPVGYLNYDRTEDGIRLHGIVYYPAQDDGFEQPFYEQLLADGPQPIVFIIHGMASQSTPSYLGYQYFQRMLARMGIVSVSIDSNAYNNDWLTINNIQLRANLIHETMRLVGTFNESHAILLETLDLDRIGLMGHSRGGEAVILASNTAPEETGMPILAVVPIAPTDIFQIEVLNKGELRYLLDRGDMCPEGTRYYPPPPADTSQEVGQTMSPGPYALMSVLPAADGDVKNCDGAKHYELQNDFPFKSQIYIHGANHGYFNTEWSDEGVGTSLTEGEQQGIMKAYGAAFFRRFLLGHDILDYLTYRKHPAGVRYDGVHLSFQFPEQTIVDNFEQDDGIDKNTLEGENREEGGIEVGEYMLSQYGIGRAPTHNCYLYGRTVGMVLDHLEGDGEFIFELANAYNLHEAEVWLRAAEVYEDDIFDYEAARFRLGLQDAGGEIGWVNVDSLGGLPRPFNRSDDSIKSMLKTLRFPGVCFTANNRNLELAEIVSIHIAVEHADLQERAIAFDELEIVTE